MRLESVGWYMTSKWKEGEIEVTQTPDSLPNICYSNLAGQRTSFAEHRSAEYRFADFFLTILLPQKTSPSVNAVQNAAWRSEDGQIETNPGSSPPNERPLTAALLEPMLHPVQSVLVPSEHHQGLEWFAREHLSASILGSFTARVPSLSR